MTRPELRRCLPAGHIDSAASAAQIANPLTHRTGSASVAATGTVQRRSVNPPQATSAAAAGNRIHSGIGMLNCATDPPSGVEPMKATHSRHSCAFRTSETATIAPVTPSAIPSARHSRRTANHSSPIPGVTLVSSTKPHVHG